MKAVMTCGRAAGKKLMNKIYREGIEAGKLIASPVAKLIVNDTDLEIALTDVILPYIEKQIKGNKYKVVRIMFQAKKQGKKEPRVRSFNYEVFTI